LPRARRPGGPSDCSSISWADEVEDHDVRHVIGACTVNSACSPSGAMRARVALQRQRAAGAPVHLLRRTQTPRRVRLGSAASLQGKDRTGVASRAGEGRDASKHGSPGCPPAKKALAEESAPRPGRRARPKGRVPPRGWVATAAPDPRAAPRRHDRPRGLVAAKACSLGVPLWIEVGTAAAAGRRSFEGRR